MEDILVPAYFSTCGVCGQKLMAIVIFCELYPKIIIVPTY